MRFLIDMNLSPWWVPFLQRHGFEASHWSELGSAAAADAEIMDFAQTGGVVILTHDLDFGRLLALRRSTSPSVVQLRTHDVLPEAIGDLVVRALKTAHHEIERGALVTIDAVQQRVRILPI